jgi:hypothetical protein
MVILLEIAMVLALVGLVAGLLLRGRKAAERAAVAGQRVEAYMQTIRREAPTPELAAMSDTELRELLMSSARNLRLQSERRWYLLIGGGFLGFLAAILVATEEGTRGFGIAMLIAAVVLYGINEYLGRRMRAPLEARGLDAERLRVE